jgi:hypothetical protein
MGFGGFNFLRNRRQGFDMAVTLFRRFHGFCRYSPPARF